MSLVQFSIRVAWSVAIAIAAGAIIFILHVFDIHPERQLAFAVLGVIADPKILDVLQWATVAIAAVASAAIYNLIAWQLLKRSRSLVIAEAISPNLRIKDAIDYIVNDSRADIPRRAPQILPDVSTEHCQGFEHSEARILLNEKANEGRLFIF